MAVLRLRFGAGARAQLGPDGGGLYLMVWVFKITSGWLHDGTLHRPPVNRPYPYPQGFAW